MKSIRHRLTVWLLGGLAVLYVAASAGIYVSVRDSLLKSIDAELAVDARIVRFAARGSTEETDDQTTSSFRGEGDRRLQEQMPAYDEPDGDAFFQMWHANAESLGKSPSLGELELSLPVGEIGTDPQFDNAVLADGRKIRTMTFRVAGGGSGSGKGKSKAKGRRGSYATITLLAKETAGVESTLSSLLGGMALVGLAAAVAAILLVRVSLNHGLKPLRELGRQTRSIDAESLDARFDSSTAPIELQPVYAHFNELIDRLETSFDRERRFSSDLAHEMRTPVAELKMLSEVALKWPDQAGEETHSASLEIANRLGAMIDTLLSLARLESGEVSLERESVELEKLAQEQWQSFADRAGQKKIEVRVEFEDHHPVFETDPAMLSHILSNLFANAAEYTPDGGEIIIAGMANGLDVTNTTSGFEAGDEEHLFDRYWRGDDSRTDSAHVGLGLSLSKACADALGLSIVANFDEPRLSIRLVNDRIG